MKLLILDLDGTLVDSFADIRYGIDIALRAIAVEPTDELMAMCRLGVGLEVFYQEALGRDPYAAEEAEQLDFFVNAYRTAYADSPHETKAYDGVAATLAAVRRARPDVAIAVATAKRTDMAQAVVDEVGLTPLLDAVVGSEGLPHKPDPAVLQRAAARVGRPVEGAIMVGDTDRDIGAARASGCVACAVTYGGWTRAELAELEPDHLFDQFSDLLGVLQRS